MSFRYRFLALLALACAFPSGVAGAQLGNSIEDYEKFDMSEIPEFYRKWVTEEVGLLITEEEFEVFQRLDSEAKFERFVEDFWRYRDPTPGTPENEYFDLHYERLAYANKFFGRSSPLPGWRTDRGRAHILLGEPEGISRVANDMILYPVETWFYSADPDLGLPPFFYLVFYQKYNTGDFRLYSPLSDGPDKLFNGAGLREIERAQERTAAANPFGGGGRPSAGYSPSGFGADSDAIRTLLLEINPDLANAAFSYFPAEAGLEFGITPLASALLIASIENINEVIMPDATWAYNVLTGVTDSDVRFETLDLRTLIVPLIDVDGEPVIHFATRAQGEELNVGEYEENYYFTFRAIGSVVDTEERVLQNFEASMSGDLEPEQARLFTRNPFIYMDLVPALPGAQTFSLMLENSVAHTFGRDEARIEVPRARPERTQIAGPIIALDAQQQTFDPFGGRYAFQYKDLAMVPAVGGEFYVGQPVSIFEQVLLPHDPPTAVTARFALTDPSGSTVREDSIQLFATSADEYGVMANLFRIDTVGLGAGEYRLQLTVDENAAATRTSMITLTEAPERVERPFINAQVAAPAIDVSVALERAKQYRVVGDTDAVSKWLDYARDREPDDPEIVREYAQILEETGRYEDLAAVLLPASVTNPRDHELLLRLGRTYTLLAQHYDAIRFYERARMVMEEESTEVLNALAAEYQAEGRIDKARELLQLSLQLEPDQTDARAMLDRITSTADESGQ
jgi:GWxTD domain-containing protein